MLEACSQRDVRLGNREYTPPPAPSSTIPGNTLILSSNRPDEEVNMGGARRPLGRSERELLKSTGTSSESLIRAKIGGTWNINGVGVVCH